MKSYQIVTILLLLLCKSVSAQDDRRILEIGKQYSEWQALLKNDRIKPKRFYHSAWGANYESEMWSPFEPVDSVTLIEVAHVYSRPGVGHLVRVNANSISGDWIINTENYYDRNGDLAFIFWTMNTFQADEPVTVEKRLYFDSRGLIKELVMTFKMNTRDPTDINFADREVTVWKRIDDIDFMR